MVNRSSGKKMGDAIAPDSDDQFAFIAGYTEGGFPYGVTWEEHEESEAWAATLAAQPLPTQLHPVSLDDISQEMQIGSDSMTIYFRRSTCEYFIVSDDHLHILESGEPFDDRPEWEQEAIQLVAEVMDQDNDDDFVPLPSQFDIHEYSIMERFCFTLEDQKIVQDLVRSLSGKGAFRRFKDALHRHCIAEHWYKFRDEAFREIAREWSEEHRIDWCD
jgi:Uncharacterised protein family (UPF0158)